MIPAEELNKAIELAKKYNIGFFKVLHEIKNHLTNLSLNIELLGEKISTDNKKIKDQFLSIYSEINGISNIIEEYLKFSTLPKLSLRKGDINEILEEIVELIEKEVKWKNIKITKNLQGNIPLIKVDIEQIKRAIINIIRNSIEAMNRGGNLTIESKYKNKKIKVNITDTGRGIKKEKLLKIFLPFYTTKGKGIGLGLTISKEIVEEHGGKIEFNRQIGKTTFTISL